MTVHVPLKLPLGACWEITADAYDSTLVFPALGALLAGATDMYIEGTNVADDVRAIYEAHASSGPYLPEVQTIWVLGGTVKQFRCRFDASLLEALSAAAERHAEPELMGSLFGYRGEQALLEWPKALSGPLWVAPEVPEERVRLFAATLRDGRFEKLDGG